VRGLWTVAPDRCLSPHPGVSRHPVEGEHFAVGDEALSTNPTVPTVTSFFLIERQ